MRDTFSFIADQKIPESGDKLINFNPASNEPIGNIHLASDSLLEEAVALAQEAQKKWLKKTPAERGKVLRNAAALLRSENDTIAFTEVEETGKPISEALVVDVVSAAECLEFFASVAETLQGEYIDLGTAFAYVRREPLGICAGIGAWNYPVQIAAWKAAPALACGNPMIFKPSEVTPSSAVAFAKILFQAGLPAGMFSVLQGDGRLGKKLVEHPKVAKVSLTGSVETGKKIATSAGSSLKKVTMELGGKSPFIVFEDADLESAVNACLLANFYTQGEICSNGTRVFLHKSIEKAFTKTLLKKVKELVIGDPKDPATHIGSLISEAHCQSVEKHVEHALSEGAKLLCGGKKLDRPGNFFPATVLGSCRDEMACVQQEIFGPVASLLTFESEEEVIERANATPFGLAAGVFTSNMARGHRVSEQIQAGIVWINNYNITPVQIPFGGMKHSGLGRENGWAAVDDYTQRKTVYVEKAQVDNPFVAD